MMMSGERLLEQPLFELTAKWEDATSSDRAF